MAGNYFGDYRGCNMYSLISLHFLSHFQTSVNRCEKICPSSPINCCLTSSPCFNGGTCVPTIGPNNIQRYTCKCPQYYHGYRCEIPIKSCKDVTAARASTFPPSPGKYAILDYNSNPFNVFCDFDNHNSTIAVWAWTLVQSYALREKFLWKPFQRESPKDSERPNWSLYRISKQRMQSIRNESTKWRVTCCYDTTYSVDYRDYVRGTFSNIDILDYYGDGCVKVDYISVRDQSCSNCTAYALQKSAIFNFPRNKGNCDLRTTNFKACPSLEQWLSKFETNFGYYGCANVEHLSRIPQHKPGLEHNPNFKSKF